MRPSPRASARETSTRNALLPYVADLELEVDRLRKQDRFVRQQVRETLRGILAPAEGGTADPVRRLAEVEQAARELAAVLQDLAEPPGYHPAHDQVVAIAVRPLVAQVFR